MNFRIQRDRRANLAYKIAKIAGEFQLNCHIINLNSNNFRLSSLENKMSEKTEVP